MTRDRHIDSFGQPATHCSKFYAAAALVLETDAVHVLGRTTPSPCFINTDRNHHDVNYNASPNTALPWNLDSSATGDPHIPIWSPNLSPSNHRFQQQAVSTVDNGWNLDVPIAPPGWDSASQEWFAQSPSHVTLGFDQSLTPALNSVDYPLVHSNTVVNGQPDPSLPLPDFGVYDDFVDVPYGFADLDSSTPWDDLIALNPQETMTSFNQLPLEATMSMPATPVLPTYATGILTAPAVPRPIARRVAARRSNLNTNPHACEYPGCGKILACRGDLVRHRQQHGVPQHPCLVYGCNRRGSLAFYRPDKLRDHQRKKHMMAI